MSKNMISAAGAKELIEMGYNEMTPEEKAKAEEQMVAKESERLTADDKTLIRASAHMDFLAREAAFEYSTAPLLYVPKDMKERIEDYYQKGDWESVCACIMRGRDYQDLLFCQYFDKLPDKYKHDLPINIYVDQEKVSPIIAYEVIRSEMYGKPTIPAELAGQDTLTVYRGGNEDIEDAPLHLSWTWDKNRAIWFMLRPGFCGDQVHLYEGKIDVKDVTEFTNERQEKEIIQFGKVRDVKELTCLTNDEAWEVNKADGPKDVNSKLKYMQQHGMI